MQSYRAPRHASNLSVRIEVGSARSRAFVVNVSDIGMKLRGISHVNAGDRITVHLQSFSFPATVRWTLGDTLGLRFDAPLSPKTLSMVRSVAFGSNTTRRVTQPLRNLRSLG